MALRAACSEIANTRHTHTQTHNGLPGNVNGEGLLEASQFTWWIGQIFLVTLYIEGPLDLLVLASLSPATIFRFPIPL